MLSSFFRLFCCWCSIWRFYWIFCFASLLDLLALSDLTDSSASISQTLITQAQYSMPGGIINIVKNDRGKFCGSRQTYVVKVRFKCFLTTFDCIFRSYWVSRSCWTSQISKTQHKQRLTQSTGEGWLFFQDLHLYFFLFVCSIDTSQTTTHLIFNQWFRFVSSRWAACGEGLLWISELNKTIKTNTVLNGLTPTL